MRSIGILDTNNGLVKIVHVGCRNVGNTIWIWHIPVPLTQCKVAWEKCLPCCGRSAQSGETKLLLSSSDWLGW